MSKLLVAVVLALSLISPNLKAEDKKFDDLGKSFEDTVGNVDLVKLPDFPEIEKRIKLAIGDDRAADLIPKINDQWKLVDFMKVAKAYQDVDPTDIREKIRVLKNGLAAEQAYWNKALEAKVPNADQRKQIVEAIAGNWLVNSMASKYEDYKKLQAQLKSDKSDFDSEQARKERERLAAIAEKNRQKRNSDEQARRESVVNDDISRNFRENLDKVLGEKSNTQVVDALPSRDEVRKMLQAEAEGKTAATPHKKTARDKDAVEELRQASTVLKTLMWLGSKEDQDTANSQLTHGIVGTSIGAGMLVSANFVPAVRKRKKLRIALNVAGAGASIYGLTQLAMYGGSNYLLNEREKRVQALRDLKLYDALVMVLGKEKAEELLADWQAGKSPEDIMIKFSPEKDKAKIDKMIKDDKDRMEIILNNPKLLENVSEAEKAKLQKYLKDAKIRAQISEDYGRYRTMIRVLTWDLSESSRVTYEKMLKDQEDEILKMVQKDLLTWDEKKGQKIQLPEAAPRGEKPGTHK